MRRLVALSILAALAACGAAPTPAAPPPPSPIEVLVTSPATDTTPQPEVIADPPHLAV